MKNTKKILSVLLATLMMLSIFTIGFTASAEESKIIDRVEITFKTDIAGKTYEDYKEIFTINTKHVNYEDAKFDPDFRSLWIEDAEGNNFDGKLVENAEYTFDFYLASDAGYKFADNVVLYVNGELVNCSIDELGSYDRLIFDMKNVKVTRPYDVFDLVADLINDAKNDSFNFSVFFARLAEVVTNFFTDTVKFFTNLFDDLFKPAPVK